MMNNQQRTLPLITFRNVEKKYAGHYAGLVDINFTIEQGEFVTFVGASGAGKSTLLKLIYAEEIPTSGMVFFRDRCIADIPRRLLPFFRRNFGMVFQDFKLLPHRTLFENVAYTLEVDGRPTSEIVEEVTQILDIVGLGDKMHKYPQQISGGEKQKTSLARALVHRPMVLIADEPTGNLDPRSTQEITDLLVKINSFGTTVLLATHNKEIVDSLGKRVVVISDGRIVRDEKAGRYE